MTVRAPGEECLTKTQEAQRAFRQKLVERDGVPSLGKGPDALKNNAVAGALLPQAIQPVENTNQPVATAGARTGTTINIVV